MFGYIWKRKSYVKGINIKFIKYPEIKINIYNPYNQKEEELYGLLKLCLLKEISSKFSYEEIKKLFCSEYCSINCILSFKNFLNISSYSLL